MPANPTTEREDSKKNRATIRRTVLRFIKKELRQPTVQELVDATGLSDKTVKRHLERIELGTGEPNPYQVLTHDVVMALHARATGYSHKAVKFMVVSQGKGVPSQVEEKEYTEHYPPDPQSAKLWLQVIEGVTDKQEVKHSGEILNQPPAVVQMVRHNPEAAHDSAQ